MNQSILCRLRGGTFALVLSLMAFGPALAQEQPSQIVASRGGASVSLADVDAFAETIPQKDRAHFFDNPQRIGTLISNLLLQKQLAAAARAAGLDRQPQFQAPLGSVSEKALAEAEVQRFRDSLPAPDVGQLAKEEYLAHKESYTTPEVLDVKYILIKVGPRSEAEAKALAEKVVEEARQNPSGFDALIAKYSDDPRKETEHGLLHEAGSKRYVAPFAAAARALAKPGDISPVVQTKYGFHVLQLVAKAPAEHAEFEDVREQVEAKVKKRYVDQAVRRRTDTLLNMPIDASPELAASLRTRYRDTPVPKDGAAEKAKP